MLERIGGPLVVNDVELETPAPGDVLIRLGLCHSDLKVIEDQLAFPLPIVRGQERTKECSMKDSLALIAVTHRAVEIAEALFDAVGWPES